MPAITIRTAKTNSDCLSLAQLCEANDIDINYEQWKFIVKGTLVQIFSSSQENDEGFITYETAFQLTEDGTALVDTIVFPDKLFNKTNLKKVTKHFTEESKEFFEDYKQAWMVPETDLETLNLLKSVGWKSVKTTEGKHLIPGDEVDYILMVI